MGWTNHEKNQTEPSKQLLWLELQLVYSCPMKNADVSTKQLMGCEIPPWGYMFLFVFFHQILIAFS